jgi:hypothetical protein
VTIQFAVDLLISDKLGEVRHAVFMDLLLTGVLMPEAAEITMKMLPFTEEEEKTYGPV